MHFVHVREIYIAYALTDAAKSPETNGIAKVLEMLAGMKEKAIKELQDEKVTFAKFSQWCDDTKIELDSAIKKGGTMIDDYALQKYFCTSSSRSSHGKFSKEEKMQFVMLIHLRWDEICHARLQLIRVRYNFCTE